MADADAGRVRVVVPSPAGDAHLIDRVTGRVPAMLDDTWWPGRTRDVIDATAGLTGLAPRIVDLRPIPDGYAVLCEAAPPGWTPPDSLRWGEDPLAALFDRDGAEPWLRRGWRDEAEAWIDAQLEVHGSKRTGATVQLKHWSISAVLLVPTNQGGVVFKEVPGYFAHEAAVVASLRELAEDAPVPGVMAAEGRRWLMRAFVEDRPDSADDEALDGALIRHARLQAEVADATPLLLARGVPDRRPDLVARAIPAMAARPAVLDRLDATERDALERVVPDLVSRCFALGGLDVPDSIVHGDLHPWNTTRTARGWLIYDWTDAGISHPFLDLCPWLWHIDDDGARGRAVAAYLSQWEHVSSPATLSRIWRLAEPVAAAHYALDYELLLEHAPAEYAPDWASGLVTWLKRAVAAVQTRHD